MAIRKILAIKLRALGDTILMTAPLIELRKAYPGAEIHVATLAPWSSILESHPAVDRLWIYERHQDRGARAKSLARLAFRLRREKFDCVVNFHASPSSSILAFATGAPIRSVHYHGHKDKNRYSTVQVPGKGTLKPIIERDMDAVRALGLTVPEGRLPLIQLRAPELTEANERLQRLGLPKPLLGIGLGASRPTKSWPVERFAALALEWARRKNGGVIALCGPTESQLAEAFLKEVEKLAPQESSLRARIQVEHTLSIRQTAAVLSSLSVYVGNDSGPKHLAVAVGTPTVTLFGPEHPFEWHPYPQDRHPYLFADNLACRRDGDPGMPAWCALDRCVVEQHKCMTHHSVSTVFDHCERITR